jgi:hypothetical protein
MFRVHRPVGEHKAEGADDLEPVSRNSLGTDIRYNPVGVVS